MPNIFDTLLGQAKSFLGTSAGDAICGVDIGSSSIKVVEIKRKDGVVVLQTYGELALGPFAGKEAGQVIQLNQEVISEAIKSLFKEAKVTAKKIFFSTRSASSLVFVLEVPSVSEREIAALLPNEMRKYIPVPVNEVVLDWWIIPHEIDVALGHVSENEKPKREVLVAAVHRDTVKTYQEIVSAASLQSTGFEIEMFSTVRSSVRYDLNATLVLDMGASSTRVAIIESGIMRSFHTIQRGSHYITQAIATSRSIPFTQAENRKRSVGLLGSGDDEEISAIARMTVNHIISEAQGVILGYEKKYGRPIQKVVLTGGGSLLKGFTDVAQEAFRANVTLCTPFQKTQAPQFLRDTLETVGPSFAVSVGLALRGLSE
jgi:type IV pilus assembly protein PilM